MANQYLRVVDEEFLMNFAKSYNKLKAAGLVPVAIRENLMREINVKESTYYRYLQLAREKHYVTDSYEENIKLSRERQKKLREAVIGIPEGTHEIEQILEAQEPVTPVISECGNCESCNCGHHEELPVIEKEAETFTGDLVVAIQPKQSFLQKLFGKILKK